MKNSALLPESVLSPRCRYRFDWAIAAVVASVMSFSAHAATYSVSPSGDDSTGDGSASKPWATIGHADANSLLSEGDTVLVQSGTYTPPSTGIVLQNSSGLDGLPITYQAQGQVVIDLLGAPGSFGFDIKASGIALEGFEIKRAAHGIRIDRASFSKITGCTIHDSAPSDSSGIWVSFANGVTMLRNVIYNIHSSGDTPWGNLGAGLRHQASHDVLFWHNLIDNAHVGILWYGDALGNPNGGTITVQNSVIVNCTGWGAANPWHTSPADFTVDHNLVWRNVIHFGNFPAGRNGPTTSDVADQDPLFAFASRHDYHLLEGSPALDLGIDLGFPFEGAAPDLGPFEGTVAPPPVGVVSGRVSANVPGSPGVRGAVVRTADGVLSTITDVDGSYSLPGIPVGTVSLQAGVRGFAQKDSSVTVVAGTTESLNFSLDPAGVSQQYYVDGTSGADSNPGTAVLPWKSIGNGDGRDILNPGDIVHVRAGTYVQPADGVRLTKRFGYAFAPITYQAEGRVLIDQSKVSGETYGFYVAVSGITVSGFEIQGAQHAIYIAPGSHDSTVDACVVHDAAAVGKNAEAIYVDRSDNVSVTRNVIYNLTDAAHAAWSPVGCGVRVQGGDRIRVLNNTIEGAFLGVFYYGGGGFGAGPYGRIATFNNIVIGCNGWGFVNPWSTDASKFTSGNNLVFANAIDYGNFPAGNNAPLVSDITGIDPGFVNAGTHDYHLANNSPALNAGTEVGLPSLGCSADIGALESAYIPPTQVYYVDSAAGNDNNSGSLAQPWASIGNGDAKGILRAGDTIVVRAGTYLQSSAEGVKLTQSHGTLSCPITYRAEGFVLLLPDGTSGTTYGFFLRSRGVVLEGFEIQGFSHGVYLAPGSDHCIVNACVMRDGVAGGANDWTDGVWVDKAADVTVSRNVIYNFNADGDTPWGHLGSGVRIQGADRLKVLNNTIDNAYVGVFYFGGAGPGGGPYGSVTTYNNIVVNCKGWGFANPWSLRAEDFTNGYNLTVGNKVAFGNYPAKNDGPVGTDVVGDPLFVDPPNGDYHLLAESPAIDKGLDVGLPYFNTAPEIGALEFPDASSPILISITRGGAGWSIEWNGGGRLQSAASLDGNWETIDGAISPFPVTPAGRARFYRAFNP